VRENDREIKEMSGPLGMGFEQNSRVSFLLRLQPSNSISWPGESWREASFFAAYVRIVVA
jgi:hypothetical protein